MIGFWRVLTSLVLTSDGTNVGVIPNWSQVRPASLESSKLLPLSVFLKESIQLHWSQTDFFHTQKDVRTGGSGMLKRTSFLHKRMSKRVVRECPSEV